MTVLKIHDFGRQSDNAIYFGWRIVLAMFIVTTMVIGNTLYAFIIFSAPLAESFGWSSAQTGSLVSALWLVAPLALFVAPVIKRVGPVPIILFSLLLQATALAAVSQITEFWQLYLLRLMMGVGKVAALVSVPVMISRWFSLRFSTAMALAWCGGSFGGLVMSPVAEFLTSRYGWDGAAIGFGLIHAASAIIVLMLCWGPTAPSDIGRTVDGHAFEAAPLGRIENATDILSGRDVLRVVRPATAIVMAVGVLLTGAGAIAMISLMPAMFKAGGLSPAISATIFGIMAGASALGQPVVGWFLDRARVPFINLAVALFLLAGAVCLAVLHIQSGLVILAFVAAICWGVGMGANEMIWITLTKRQFGTAMFAYTYGAWSCALQAGYAIGGPIGGWTYDYTNPLIFPLLAALLYLPAVLFAVWRPGIRNEE